MATLSEMKKSYMKAPKTKPKGEKGMAQVKKLGRTKKTGGFDKIAAKAGAKYGSATAGKRVAGAIFQKMAKHHAMMAKHHANMAASHAKMAGSASK